MMAWLPVSSGYKQPWYWICDVEMLLGMICNNILVEDIGSKFKWIYELRK